MTARWAELVWSYPCPDCDARPGANCRTASGHVKAEPHTARVDVVVRCSQCRQWLHAEAADQGLELCEACLARVRDRS